MYLHRGLERRLQASLELMPLVILEGARATGKTRLVEHAIERGWLAEVRSFLDPAELNAARAAPRDYVFGLPHGTAIDEAQLCEDILLPVKERVERSEPGALLLTGSTRLRRDELGGSDPLAGRVGSPLRLGPLTIGERSGAPQQLVKQLFEGDPQSIELGASIGRTDLIGLVQEPGLPGLVGGEPAARSDRARAYIPQTTTQSSFATVDVQRVNQLARYLAGRTSTPVNVNKYSGDVGLARPSVEKYLAHLEEALVIVRLPGWRRSKDKSETDRAKVHFFDAGIACAAAHMTPSDQDEDLGRLAETLLVTDLARQAMWLPEPPSCYHWRRSDRDEVDLVLESSDRRAVCVEVKVAENVSEKDFRGIDAFREHHATSFHRGFVFYTGSNVLPFGEDRWAIPFAALRSVIPSEPTPSTRRDIPMRRESTNELWTRVLRQLIDMTRAAGVDWGDSGARGTYMAPTGSGAITITTHVGGLGGLEAPVSAQVAHWAGLPTRITLSMNDAKGEPVSSIQLEEPDQSPAGRAEALILSGNSETEGLYDLAAELAALIEATRSRASSVADSILDDLESE